MLREIEGYAPRNRIDGHATCFLASGFEKAILLDFNYKVEPLPGKFAFPGMEPFSLLQGRWIGRIGLLYAVRIG